MIDYSRKEMMDFCSNRIKYLIILTLLIPGVARFATLYADIRYMAFVNYEMTKSYVPGFDFSMLINRNWGIRYTLLPDVRYGDSVVFVPKSNEVVQSEIKGDFTMPFLLKTIDYRSKSGKSATPLDFITAYFGAGYNRVRTKVKYAKYRPENDSILEETDTEKIDMPVYAMTFGFCGGERFLAIDARVLYLYGQTDELEETGEKIKFDNWYLVVGFGVSF